MTDTPANHPRPPATNAEETGSRHLTAAELADAVRGRRFGHPKIERTIRAVAVDLATEMRRALPHLPDDDLGAALLHTGTCLAGLIERLRAGGVSDWNCAASAVNVASIAGERLHTAAQTARVQDTTPTLAELEHAVRDATNDLAIARRRYLASPNGTTLAETLEVLETRWLAVTDAQRALDHADVAFVEARLEAYVRRFTPREPAAGATAVQPTMTIEKA